VTRANQVTMSQPTPTPPGPPPTHDGPRVPSSRLTTFDCFDTVITRAVGSPHHVAYPVAHAARRAGLLEHDVAVVVAARRQAENLVWRRRPDVGTLDDIWAQAVELLGVDESVAPRLKDIELDVERRLLHPVPQAVAEVREARRVGDVGFLSDTPLSSTFIGQVLHAGGVREDTDQLWVSNELGASKNRGGAYFEVARRLGGAPQEWVHVGDSRRSDVTTAERSGVTARLRQRAGLTRYEKRLDASAADTAGLGPLLAGVSRLTRLQIGQTHPDIPAARVRVIAGVAAPLLAGYVLWCLAQARRAGVRRLYFVSRDGEVMLRLARRLAPALGLDLDLRYLQGSRRAWLLPAMTTMDADRLASVMGREERVTVRSCLSWVDLDPEEVQDLLRGHGFAPGTYDHVIDVEAMGRLVDVLVGEGRELLTSRAALRTEAAEEYMRELGLLDDEPYGLVDIGWQGTVGRLLTSLLEPMGGRPPALECYYGLNAPSHEAADRKPRGYMFDNWRGVGVGRITDLWVALEMFTAALPGRVERYEVVDGLAVPVHGPANAAATAWGLPGQHAVLDTFGDVLAAHLDLVDPWVDVRGPTHDTLTQFWNDPRPDEVDAFGDYPFEADADTYPIARPFTLTEVARALRQGRLRLRRRGTWPAGSRRAAPVHLRTAQHVVGGGRLGVDKLRRAYGFWRGRRLLGAPGVGSRPTAHGPEENR